MHFTTAIAVVAGLCIAFGALYLFVGVRRPTNRVRNLLFAGFAFAYAGAILAARSSYLADSVDGFVTANGVSILFAGLGFSFFVFYVAAYTGLRPRGLLWTLTGAFLAFGFAAVVAPDLVFGDAAGRETLVLPWGEVIRFYQADEGVLFPLSAVATLATFVFVIVAAVTQYRRSERREAVVLAIGIGWFMLMVLEENLVGVGAIDWPPLADFGFLGFVLALSLGMTDEAIDTQEELLDYRSNLERMVQKRTEELEQAQALLLAAAEDEAAAAERGRLARDLHDVVTQILFSINLVAGSLTRLWETNPPAAARSTAELQRLTRGALAEMRTLLRELRPHTITETDLGILITHLAEGLGARHDIPAVVHVEVEGAPRPEVHLAYYRIAQEAMNNVAKHADASSLNVEVVGNAHYLRLVVQDDGSGYQAEDGNGGSMGLAIMQERADGIGAKLLMTSELGKGTTVAATWRSSDDG